MRDDSTLAYRLGMLNNHYDYLTRQWDGDVDLYDSFHDIHVHENPHLREMASTRGKIDALEYIRDDELPPGSDEYDWLNTDRNDALLRNVTEAAVDAITRTETQPIDGEPPPLLVYLRVQQGSPPHPCRATTPHGLASHFVASRSSFRPLRPRVHFVHRATAPLASPLVTSED